MQFFYMFIYDFRNVLNYSDYFYFWSPIQHDGRIIWSTEEIMFTQNTPNNCPALDKWVSDEISTTHTLH